MLASDAMKLKYLLLNDSFNAYTDNAQVFVVHGSQNKVVTMNSP